MSPRLWRLVSNILIISGFVLLAIWGASTFYRFAGNGLAIQVWAESNTEQSPGDREPDYSLWSQKRIQAYKKALAQHLGPTKALLRIPRLNIEVAVLEGTSEWALNRGAGHIEGSAPLDGNGNAGIASHRDGFFRGLKDIRIDDEVVLELRTGRRTYVVDEVRIVYPDQIEVLNERAAPSLTLVTCYPFYFNGDAPQRYIVKASLKGSDTNLPPAGASLAGSTP